MMVLGSLPTLPHRKTADPPEGPGCPNLRIPGNAFTEDRRRNLCEQQPPGTAAESCTRACMGLSDLDEPVERNGAGVAADSQDRSRENHDHGLHTRARPDA